MARQNKVRCTNSGHTSVKALNSKLTLFDEVPDGWSMRISRPETYRFPFFREPLPRPLSGLGA